jgi:hypothetical protein
MKVVVILFLFEFLLMIPAPVAQVQADCIAHSINPGLRTQDNREFKANVLS